MNGRSLIPVCLAACLLVMSAAASAPRLIGYFPYWAQYSQFYPKDVRYEFVTHVHYGYFVPQANGELQIADAADQGNFETLVKLGKERGVQVLVSVGGPGNAEAVQAVASGEARGTFVRQIMLLIKQYKLAGIELDWLPPETEKGNYAELVKELSRAFAAESPRPLLALTASGNEANASGYDADAMQLADYVVVNALDLADYSAPQVQPNASGVATEAALNFWANRGIEKQKLVAAVPFYGKSFSNASGLGSSHEGPGSGNEGYLSYKELMEKFDGPTYKVSYDEASQSEVAVSATETIVFSGIPSVKAVARTVKDNAYGGIAAYDLSGDHPHWKVSLLVTIGSVLRPGIDYKAKPKK